MGVRAIGMAVLGCVMNVAVAGGVAMAAVCGVPLEQMPYAKPTMMHGHCVSYVLGGRHPRNSCKTLLETLPLSQNSCFTMVSENGAPCFTMAMVCENDAPHSYQLFSFS